MNANPSNPQSPPAPLSDRRLAELLALCILNADGTCGVNPMHTVGHLELWAMTRELSERRARGVAAVGRGREAGVARRGTQ
jgi:hypothetical protein